MADLPDEDDAPDGTHVAFLYRGVVAGRSVLTLYLGFSVLVFVLSALALPVTAVDLWETGVGSTSPSLEPDLPAAALVLGLFVAIPVAVITLGAWHRCVRALFQDFPPGSAWFPHLLRPFRRRYWWSWAAFAATSGSLVSLLALAGLAASGIAAGASYVTSSTVAEEYEAVVFLGVAVPLVAAQWIVLPAFGRLIAGSEIPHIDRLRVGSERLARWTAPTLLAATAVVLTVVGYSSLVDASLPYLSVVGLIAPAGAVVAAWSMRRAYSEWIALAYRLIGKRPVV